VNLALRATLGWLILFVVMFANGAVRVVVLQPRLGEDRARQVASLIGVFIVFAVSAVFVRVSPQVTLGQLMWIGVTWCVATLAFEFLFGRFVSRQSWSTLLADYNILRGRLWLLIIVAVCVAPWACGAVAQRAK